MIKLKNKAENLQILKKIFFKNSNIIIPNFYFFSIRNLNLNKKYYLKKILDFSRNYKIILRSSSFDEDTINYSNAGKYDSIIIKKNITNNELKKILNKFLKQFKNKNDTIIVQKFIEKVQISGVIFTSDMNSNAQFYGGATSSRTLSYYVGGQNMGGSNSNQIQYFTSLINRR